MLRTGIVLFTFFFSSISYSDIEKFQVAGVRRHEFSLKEACQGLVNHEVLLADIEDANTLDCMGTKVSIADFCLKKFKDDSKFLRGFARKSDHKVVCQFGGRVDLRYSCHTPESKGKYCRNSLKACDELKDLFAKKLNILHHSLVINFEGEKYLNCHYGISQNHYDEDGEVKILPPLL